MGQRSISLFVPPVISTDDMMGSPACDRNGAYGNDLRPVSLSDNGLVRQHRIAGNRRPVYILFRSAGVQ